MFGKDKKEDTQQPVADANANNILGRGTRMTGDIEATGNFRLEGDFEGNLICKAKVVVSETATLKGNLQAQNAEIAGKFEGELQVQDVLVVRSKAHIKGTLVTKKLMVEAGASITGQCQAGEQASKSPAKPEPQAPHSKSNK